MEMKVEMLKAPTEQDWLWCKQCTINTMGFKNVKTPVDERWKRKLIKSEHSPLRELWFGFRLTIPYWVSVHIVRHHIGCNHYVSTQRDDRTNGDIPRGEKPQGEMVSHILSINAQELVQFMHKRLCNQASEETRLVARMIRDEVIKKNPEFASILVPLCAYRNGLCTEFFPCKKGVDNEQ